jgi:hypothetical protein
MSVERQNLTAQALGGIMASGEEHAAFAKNGHGRAGLGDGGLDADW